MRHPPEPPDASILRRLWDDLADLNFDRNNHPDRTLVTSSNIRPYFILVAGLTVLSAMILAVMRPPSHWFTYVLLLAGTAIIYRRQVWPGAWRLVRMQLVLIKYPVFLYLCAQDGTPVSMARSGIAVYLLLSFIDLLSDATLRLLPARRWLLILELALFAVFMGTLLWSI